MSFQRKSKRGNSQNSLKKFKKIVTDFYQAEGRHTLPWRTHITPYRIIVSEIMLQQTQVDRVTSFFKKWMKEFPSFKKLAEASQGDVLRVWKGLGYNSRALRLKRLAEIVTRDFKGVFPKHYDDIIMLPGIGPYTAGAISAFVYNQPRPLIETNIRRVYLHHFFNVTSPLTLLLKGEESRTVHDKELLEIIRQTIDLENPREWYWALMDYGAYLGKTIPNPNKKSRHYTVQKKFKGSDREIRGKILEILLQHENVSFEDIMEYVKTLSDDRERVEMIIERLGKEGFLSVVKNKVILKR